MNLTDNEALAVELATTEEFSVARLKMLRMVYDRATETERQKIGELVEVFVALVKTADDEEAIEEIWG